MLIHFLLLLISPSNSQLYNSGNLNSYYGGMPRQHTVLVPVYTQTYGGYQPPPMYGATNGAMCCGGEQYGMGTYSRNSKIRSFLHGAADGFYMGTVGMFGFRR